MKVFLAIELQPELKSLISETIAPLHKEYPAYSWVPQENYHITVQYIGEVPSYATVGAMRPIIEELTFDIEKLTLYSHMASVLINSRITLYLEFYKNNALNTLVKRLQDSLGIRSRYRYMPHLTFAKYKIPSKQQYLLLKKTLHTIRPEIAIPVPEICMFESVMAYPFPVYRKLETYPLAEPLGK